MESILTPTEFKETLALVVFDHFDVPSLCFAPSHLLAIYTVGIDTALVIDAGKSKVVMRKRFDFYATPTTHASASILQFK